MANGHGPPIRSASTFRSARAPGPMTPRVGTGASRRSGGPRSMRSGTQGLRPAAAMTGRRACAIITLRITRRFSGIPTATGSKPSAITRFGEASVQAGQPSHTARGAAAYRAIHQTLEGGAIFSDPFATRILDDESRARLDETAADLSLRPWRLFIAARSRYASQGVRVFEVDYPATQGWKRERLKQAGLAIPRSLTFAPVDFERQGLADGLKAAGFYADRPAFFQWLGVVMYLSRDAVSVTLDFIAGVPESEVVFDYAEPFENYRAERRENVMALAARAGSLGEPWLSLFDPVELSQMLRNKGFGVVEDLGLAELTERFYGALKQGIVIGPGAHVVRAQNTR